MQEAISLLNELEGNIFLTTGVNTAAAYMLSLIHIFYDNLASSSLLNEVRDDAELIYAGKRSSNHHLKQYETCLLYTSCVKFTY